MTADVMALKRPERKPFTLVVAAKVRGRMAEQTRLQEDLAARYVVLPDHALRAAVLAA